MVAPVAPMSFARQPLDLILASTGNVRVLRALIAGDRPVSIAELTGETRITPGGVRKVVAALEALGMVEALGSGRTRLFRVAPDHVLAAALATLFGVERGRLDRLFAAVTEAVSAPEVEAAWAFGGVVRGDDHARRDVDLAVVVRPEPRAAGDVLDEIGSLVRARAGSLGFDLSVVVLSPGEVLPHADESSALWTALVAGHARLKGPDPRALARSLRAGSGDREPD